MQHLEVSCAVRRFFKSLGFKGLMCGLPGSTNIFSSFSHKKSDFRKKLCIEYEQTWGNTPL